MGCRLAAAALINLGTSICHRCNPKKEKKKKKSHTALRHFWEQGAPGSVLAGCLRGTRAASRLPKLGGGGGWCQRHTTQRIRGGGCSLPARGRTGANDPGSTVPEKDGPTSGGKTTHWKWGSAEEEGFQNLPQSRAQREASARQGASKASCSCCPRDAPACGTPRRGHPRPETPA